MWFFAITSMFVLGLVVWVAGAVHVFSVGPLAEAAGRKAPRGEWAELATIPRWDRLDGASTTEAGPYWPSGQIRPEIPIPADARLVTSATRTQGEGYLIQVELAVAISAADAMTFYREQLSARGWEEVGALTWRPTDGHLGVAGTLGAFCRDTDGPLFLVAVAPTSAGTSTVHVRIALATPSPCMSPSFPRSWVPDKHLDAPTI